ncbi:hypothetical protein H5P28_04085 [Ruficoccus amylovorans]|uniref:Uncharacterized protein n=1 Tax=Ruficoccus amylovorans TaxID=1804625 RepID=A0A842HAA9_9BACT|nr:hypothetical protein [Ruficoccus amylovorans]MBC2593433.1 hypothetical protein [Ruficoccus amylovorans]
MKIPTLLHKCAPVVLAAVLGASASVCTLRAQVVPIKRRAVILAAGERYLVTFDQQKLDEINSLKYPFAFEAEQAPATVETPQTQTAPELPSLTDEQVLAAFSSKFNPTGMMARGDVNYLLVPLGKETRPVAAGSLIRFNYQNEAYDVRLGEVTDDEYTLQLGEARLVRRLDKSFDPDRIKRFTPQP